VLCQTIGTPWQIDLDGRIILLEEVGEAPWRMDALLTHLRQAGALDRVAGVVIADLVACDWSEARPEHRRTPSLEDVLERHFESLGVPTIYGLPIGHGKHFFTTPLGVHATLDAGPEHCSSTSRRSSSPPSGQLPHQHD
jgi:muramoyltetrapeptide carboxypeptidase